MFNFSKQAYLNIATNFRNAYQIHQTDFQNDYLMDVAQNTILIWKLKNIIVTNAIKI